MSQTLTMKEIEKQYANEWVLIDEPLTNEMQEVLSGKVVWHTPDEDEIDRKAMEAKLKNWALLYMGDAHGDTVFVL